MRILAIETSCDETAIAVADFGGGRTGARMHAGAATRVRVLSHIVSSQAKIHAAYGGVVPNLARREHEKNLVPILMTALRESGIAGAGRSSGRKTPRGRTERIRTILAREPDLLGRLEKHIAATAPPDIDAIAVTSGPGLAPALWTGVNFAQALAILWDKPVIPVNHMAGHFFSALIQKMGREEGVFVIPAIAFPVLALLVSGGHTELVLVARPWRFEIIGETRDDAVGEAFDKVARIMGLAYPGGPEISRLAASGRADAYALPRPMMRTRDYDFSFSGLKTAVLYLVRDTGKLTLRNKKNIAASFQAAALDVLVHKTIRAAKEYRIKTLTLGGGVAANEALRAALNTALKKERPDRSLFIPDPGLCGDNALMIAAAAYFCETGKKRSPEATEPLRADPNARLG
jgi:N6-L-threonylcarbamoyladenine synthase